jgi:hypothetical protein
MQPRIHLGPSAAPSQIFLSYSYHAHYLGASQNTAFSVQPKTVFKKATMVPLNFLILPHRQTQIIFGGLSGMSEYVNTCLQTRNATLSPPSPPNRNDLFF